MPTPLYKILLPSPNGYCLAGNPVIVGFWVGESQSARYRVYTGTNFDVLEYDGVVSSLTDWAKVDIASLFSEMKINAGVLRAKILMVDNSGTEYGQSENTPANEPVISVFGGAISKLLIRYLAKSNTDIFSWKLKNSTTNFFLTTRTNSYTICVPENELLPLYYYAKGLKFDIKANDEVVLSKDHTTDAVDSLQNIDFSSLRLSLVASKNKLISDFRIVTAQGWSCTLVITQAEVKSDFQLKFKNSWGVYEKISIGGPVKYTPTTSEAVKINEYDDVISGFVSTSDRNSMTSIYTAELGYKTALERLFILDMLMKRSVVLIAYDREYGCNVSSDTSLISSTSGDTVLINLKIELHDADEFYSPLFDDSDYSVLASSDGSEITADGANILV